MPELKSWAELQDVEKRVRDEIRRVWILEAFEKGDTVMSLAEKLDIDRTTLQRILRKTGALKGKKSQMGKPGPKPRAPKLTLAILSHDHRKKYDALRGELGLSHLEALSRMVAEVQVNA